MKEKSIQINVNELKKIQFKEKAYKKNLKNVSKEIKRSLKQAVIMDNNQEGRVSLVFRSKRHGKLQVHSPVLMLGSDFVVLRGGRTLPVGSIEKVIL